MTDWVEFEESPGEILCPECGFHHTHSRAWWEPGDPLVTFIAFWPVEERGKHGFDNRWISRCHYRTACAHAHYNLQLVEHPWQAEIPPGLPVIALEEPYPIDTAIRGQPNGPMVGSGELAKHEVHELHQYDHPINATYIVGNTYYQRPSEHFTVDECIGITMDDNEIARVSPLYGSQLITLVWYDRKLKALQLETEE